MSKNLTGKKMPKFKANATSEKKLVVLILKIKI